MKAFLAFLLIVGVLAGLYYGYVFVISKAFNTAPKQDQTEQVTAWRGQSQKTEELMQRQKDLIRQRQDQMRDKLRR